MYLYFATVTNNLNTSMAYNKYTYLASVSWRLWIGYSFSGLCLAPHPLISIGHSMSHDQAQSHESGTHTKGRGKSHTTGRGGM